MKARILLIEDNEQNRYLARFLLEQGGHEVLQAETGPLGLALAAQTRRELILRDIRLPGMDGHTGARALKSDAALRRIPIVPVPTSAMAGDQAKCLHPGAEGYIENP